MQTFLTQVNEQQNTAVSLGFFDGLHKGHRKVLSLAASQAANGLTPVCLTFRESPKTVLGARDYRYLMTREDKLRALEGLGIAHTVLADFRDIMHLPARTFFENVLVEQLRAKKLYCGFNSRFGKNAGGDTALLALLCEEYGIELTVVPPEKTEDGRVICSTRIKELIREGNVREANEMLCSRFGFSSVITHGKQLGRELGTPTINQSLLNDLVVPRFGVYASEVTLESGERFCGVTNVGVKPTVGGETPLWETWMPDYHGGEIYGQKADVRLLDFIRPERKFGNLKALRDEILGNAAQAWDIYQSLDDLTKQKI